MEREIICTSCPMGCHITVTMEEGKILSVTGNTCARGDAYARSEVTDPKRTITTTVALDNGSVLPVKSSAALSKNRLPEYLARVQQIVAKTPVCVGDILLEDIDGCGVNIVATANS